MPFVNSAKAMVKALPPGDRTRVVLEVMLKHAVGIDSAQPWQAVERMLKKRGIRITLQTFQQTILKATRQGDIFIGSNDHEPGKGYFLIKDKEDAETMQKFYEKRIASEKANLKKLNRLIEAQWPRI
jgi:hypothetical protein